MRRVRVLIECDDFALPDECSAEPVQHAVGGQNTFELLVPQPFDEKRIDCLIMSRHNSGKKETHETFPLSFQVAPRHRP